LKTLIETHFDVIVQLAIIDMQFYRRGNKQSIWPVNILEVKHNTNNWSIYI